MRAGDNQYSRVMYATTCGGHCSTELGAVDEEALARHPRLVQAVDEPVETVVHVVAHARLTSLSGS